MMQTLREQNQVWQEVDRKVAEQDKVRIDFEGYLEDKLFEGGSAKGHELIIGKGTMIPGFESGLIGAEKGKPCSLQLTFPQEYGHQELAGKEARFEVTIETIWEGSLPELNEEFAEKLDIKEGGVEALRQDIRENMERELQHRVEVINRERMLKALIKHNPIELPHVMVEKEIQQLRHEMYHRLFGAEHREDEKIPDFPRVLFESEAKHRVHMSLLFSEYVKLHNIEPDAQKVEAMVGVLSTAYEDPAEFRKHYTENRREREKIEGLVLENMVAEKIGEHAILVEKDVPYSEIMHPKKEEQEQKGE
jgi:trigger factor